MNKYACVYTNKSKKLCLNDDCFKCFYRSFQSSDKSIFFSFKNNKKPREIFKTCNNIFIFGCDFCTHEFYQSLNNISAGQWCPYCANSKLCSYNNCISCSDKSFENSEKANCWSIKNNKKSREVFKFSNKKFIFNCNVCFHEFTSSLCTVSSGYWCPYCSNQKLCSNDDCNSCLNKSFMISNKVDCWSEKNIKKPRDVFISSSCEYLFQCKECNHEFSSPLSIVTKGQWCPFCANRRLCLNVECNICSKKSFMSSEKKNLWSDKNIIKPRDVFNSSESEYIFQCDLCPHEFTRRLSKISKCNGNGCLFCMNKILCSNECEQCFEKSFESHEKSQFWSEKNIKKPRNVFIHSNTSYIFNCKNCNNEYIASLCNISSGKWCPCESNKTENKLHKWLKEKYFSILKQKTYEWCKNPETNKFLPFDFVIEKYKIIIELDGEQHFRQVRNWLNPEIRIKIDVYKMKKANENGYNVIRILQTDVWYDKNNWEDKLSSNIKNFLTPICIYIDNKNEYCEHKIMMKTLKNEFDFIDD